MMQNMNLDKDFYIRQISKASDYYGDKLLLLMDRYNKLCLYELSLEEVKEFYEKEILHK